MDISIGQPMSDIHTWIYPWIYPWISISTATLKTSNALNPLVATKENCLQKPCKAIEAVKIYWTDFHGIFTKW